MSEIINKINAMRISWLGKLVYYCIPYRRRIIKKNINQVFEKQLNNLQQKKLAQAYYSHLLTCIKEAFYMRFLSEEQLRAKVEIKGHEQLIEISKQNKGILVLTGHFGNWEFAPIGGILNFKDFQGQFHFIRRTLGNKFIEKILFRRYYLAGLNIIPKKNSLMQVCDVLEKNHAVVFVLDQHASLVNRDGVAVEFFGKKAGTYRSLASIARHTGIPVVPAAGYRLPNGKHVLEFFEPIPWEDHTSTQESIYHNTKAYNSALEHIILQHPEQWMWLHKRWKLKDACIY